MSVRILPVLATMNSGSSVGPLEYGPENIIAQRKNRELLGDYWVKLLDSEIGSDKEQAAARQLAIAYLGETALQIEFGVKGKDITDRQSDWFTEQSLEIYGPVSREDAIVVMREDLTQIEASPAHTESGNLLRHAYARLGVKTDDTRENSRNTSEALEVRQELGDYLQNRYGFLINLVDADKVYTAKETADLCKSMLDELKKRDPRWIDWHEEFKTGGSMEVVAKEKAVKIGDKRAPSSGRELGPSLAHELLDHALRSVNGESISREAQYGIPGYLDFEEGWGCYLEASLAGTLPSKIANRQLAVGLALGLVDGIRYDRHQIFEILKLRTEAQLDAEGITDNTLRQAKISELRTLVIDRFYRGGKGLGQHAAVFVKDKIYGEGFRLAEDYVLEQRKRGKSIDEIFDFLSQGKFDPTVEAHLKTKNVN